MNSLAVSSVPTRGSSSTATVPDVSLLRLNLLRGPYALMAIGLGAYIWPAVIHHSDALAASRGVQISLLAGLGATAALGIRYPLQMLPVLIFELVWKAIFLIAFVLPLYLAGQLDDGMTADAFACLMVVVFLPVIPWRYVWANFVSKPGERWK